MARTCGTKSSDAGPSRPRTHSGGRHLRDKGDPITDPEDEEVIEEEEEFEAEERARRHRGPTSTPPARDWRWIEDIDPAIPSCLLNQQGQHMSNFGRLGLPLPYINLRGGWFSAKRLYDVLPDSVAALVDAAGFDEFMHLPAMAMDQSYVVALLERYRFETFNFHFRWGEMIVLPSHIALLTGLQVRGVRGRLVRYDPRILDALVEELAGEVIPWGPTWGLAYLLRSWNHILSSSSTPTLWGSSWILPWT